MIPNKILKFFKNVISQSLADIFNTSIQSGIFPDGFKMAGVTPIFKEREKGDVSKVHSLSSGKVAATPILKSVTSQFSPFIL